MRALGITYSGGFGIFATKGKAVRSPADMRGHKLQTDRFLRLTSYVQLLGVEPLSGPPEAFVPMSKLGYADAVETTVARFDEYGDDRGTDVVNLTNHFLLTTMVIVNEKFFQGLPAKYQAKLKGLALETSREERSLSIKANEDGRKRLESRGVKFVDLTAEQRAAFAAVLKPIENAPWSFVGADWAQEIRATRAVRTVSR